MAAQKYQKTWLTRIFGVFQRLIARNTTIQGSQIS